LDSFTKEQERRAKEHAGERQTANDEPRSQKSGSRPPPGTQSREPRDGRPPFEHRGMNKEGAPEQKPEAQPQRSPEPRQKSSPPPEPKNTEPFVPQPPLDVPRRSDVRPSDPVAQIRSAFHFVASSEE